MSEQWLTVKQVAELAQTAEKTVRRAIDKGSLEAFYVGSRLRIEPVQAQAWLRSRPAGRVVRPVRRRSVDRSRLVRGGFADLMEIDRKAATR